MIAECYHCGMGQVLIRNLDDALLDSFRDAAKAHGRSLEAELRDALARAQPLRPKDVEALGRLSREARAMTPPGGPDSVDSTLGIRWDRDTDHGRDIDDGWLDREPQHARR